MTAMFRVDHVPNGAIRNGETTWWPDEDSALAEASRLRWAGCQRVVAWRWDGAEARDVAAEGLGRGQVVPESQRCDSSRNGTIQGGDQ
jgi:hypothetical protein